MRLLTCLTSCFIKIAFVCFIAFGFTVKSLTASSTDSLFKATMETYEENLLRLTDSITMAKVERNRYVASYDFIKTLVEALKTRNSFDYSFSELETISLVYPEDRSFRIFNWQIQNLNGTYRHFGAIQINQAELKLFPLVDVSDFTEEPQSKVFEGKDWYGCIYYNIITTEHRGKKMYNLFGWDGHDVFSNKKIIDVLTFDRKGVPSFGAPIFTQEKGGSKRVMRFMIEFKETAQTSLNFNDSEKMILYDNLITIHPESVGVNSELVPDGTYRGMKWEKGHWRHIDKVYHGAYEKAPVPNPVDFE